MQCQLVRGVIRNVFQNAHLFCWGTGHFVKERSELQIMLFAAMPTFSPLCYNFSDDPWQLFWTSHLYGEFEGGRSCENQIGWGASGISNCLSSFVARPQVYHEVDVHRFADWRCGFNRRFDRIVFNLPHAGTLFPQTQEAHPAQLEEHRFALLCWPICRNLGLGVDMLYGFSKKSSCKIISNHF